MIGLGQYGVVFSHGASVEFELEGVVDEAVEDGVGEQFMPLSQRELAGDEGGARGGAVFEEFAAVEAVLGVELGESEVVEDEEVGFGEGGEELGVAAVAARDGEVVEESGGAQVGHGEAVAAGSASVGLRSGS